MEYYDIRSLRGLIYLKLTEYSIYAGWTNHFNNYEWAKFTFFIL